MPSLTTSPPSIYSFGIFREFIQTAFLQGRKSPLCPAQGSASPLPKQWTSQAGSPTADADFFA